MRAMAFVWAVILVGGIAYFSIIGLPHQFALFALATVWLLQKGSPESKELDKAPGCNRSPA